MVRGVLRVRSGAGLVLERALHLDLCLQRGSVVTVSWVSDINRLLVRTASGRPPCCHGRRGQMVLFDEESL